MPMITIEEFKEDPEVIKKREEDRKRRNQLFIQEFEQKTKPKLQNPPKYTIEEVKQHNTDSDAWTVVNGKIYNFTSYISLHPGGRKIMKAAGKDSSKLFKIFHKGVDIDNTIMVFFFEGLLVDAEGNAKVS